MRWIVICCLLAGFNGYGQWKSFIIGVKGDTLNGVDLKGQKQGRWVVRYDEIRGEPGYEEEGVYRNDKKEGVWRRYSLTGDLMATENFRWGNKDGVNRYFTGFGELTREEQWRAINPNKLYDTVDVEDVDKPDHYTKVIVKNEGAGIRHGTWKYYDPASGLITKTENYTLGKLEGNKKSLMLATAETDKKPTKPKEVLDYQKKNAGKKKIRVRDGSTGY